MRGDDSPCALWLNAERSAGVRVSAHAHRAQAEWRGGVRGTMGRDGGSEHVCAKISNIEGLLAEFLATFSSGPSQWP